MLDAGDRVIDVVASAHNSAALTKAGALYIWGAGDSGQIGNARHEPAFLPARVRFDAVALPTASAASTTAAAATVHVSQVALGERHCLALSTDGRVWSWGSNEFGALGRSTTADAPLTLAADAAAAAAAPATSAVDTSSTPHTIAALSPEALTAANGGASDAVVQIACSASTSFARTRAGRVFVWGAHDTQQLGLADAQMDAHVPRALVLPAGDAGSALASAPAAAPAPASAAAVVVQRLWVGRLNCVCEAAGGRRYGWGFHLGARPREMVGLPRAPGAGDAPVASHEVVAVGGDSVMFCV